MRRCRHWDEEEGEGEGEGASSAVVVVGTRGGDALSSSSGRRRGRRVVSRYRRLDKRGGEGEGAHHRIVVVGGRKKGGWMGMWPRRCTSLSLCCRHMWREGPEWARSVGEDEPDETLSSPWL